MVSMSTILSPIVEPGNKRQTNLGNPVVLGDFGSNRNKHEFIHVYHSFSSIFMGFPVH